MLVNNLVGAVLCSLIYTYTALFTSEDSHTRILRDPQLLFDCLMIGLAGTIGQIFIFFCISVFDCYLLSVITTTRKFFSVFYSNFRFGHQFNNMQWLGALLVMSCTALELLSKKGGKKKDSE